MKNLIVYQRKKKLFFTLPKCLIQIFILLILTLNSIFSGKITVFASTKIVPYVSKDIVAHRNIQIQQRANFTKILPSYSIKEAKHEASLSQTTTNNNLYDTPAFVSSYLTGEVAPENINYNTKVAYLTFDDGPSETVTPKILEILKEKNVKGIFFVVGKYLDSKASARELLKKISSEGHTIGNHTYSHDYDYLYPNRSANTTNIMSDIEKNNSIIRQVLGDNFNVNLVRLPGGHMSWNNLQETDYAFSQNGYYSIDWNALNGDAEGKKLSSEELVQRAKDTIANNNCVVILMHDGYGKEETAKALPEIIDYLKEKGYEFHNII